MAPTQPVVIVRSVTTVVPSKPSPRYPHFLSNLDLRFDDDNYYAQCVFLFRDGVPAGGGEAVVESLRSSLAATLVHFPVLAGRLSKSAAGRTEVDVNGQGIPFYESSCDASLDDWAELRCCPIDLSLNPVNAAVPPEKMHDVPLIRIQATLFSRGGGVALGFSALHMLVDGANAIDFMKAWGEIHRGAATPSTPPRFAAWMLAARDPPVVRVPLDSKFSFADFGGQVHSRAAAEAGGKTTATRSTVFVMESAMVDRCVSEVEKGPYGYGRATSYEAISALFWSAITRARAAAAGAAPPEDVATSYTVPMSVARRGRFDPPLPSGFFGNAVVMGLASATAAELGGRHFSYAASLIHNKAKSYSIELAKSTIDCYELRLQQGKTAAALSIGEGPPSGWDVLSTNFVAFPVYEIEFGFAKLAQMIFSFPMDSSEGVISMLPTADGGRSREIAVCLRSEALDKLCNDVQLREYVTPCTGW